MTNRTHAQTQSTRGVGLVLLTACAALLSGCGESIESVEQIRQRHDDTMGHPVKITYEIGDDWVDQNSGRYTRANIPVDDISLYVDIDSARVKGDDFSARLTELKKGPRNNRKRERITAQIITLDEQPAVEFAIRQESSRHPNVNFVSHRFEFIRGDYYITVKLWTRDEHYDRFIDQLRHTANSVELEPGP